MWNADVSIQQESIKKILSEFGQIHCLLMKLDFKRPPQFWWLVFFGLVFICFYNAEAPSFPLVEKEFLILFFFKLTFILLVSRELFWYGFTFHAGMNLRILWD